MFQLTKEETDSLRSQFAILENDRGQHQKYLPYAFTEQGIAMLSGVLNSERSIEVNIQIMRAFVRLREIFATNKEFAHKLAELGESNHVKSNHSGYHLYSRRERLCHF